MLFNKDERGSQELYNISGIFQAGADYRNIEAEVNSALETVRDIIGPSVMSDAEQAYEQLVIPPCKEALVKAVQLPVAYLAIAMHAQLSLVAHGETGRKIKADDNEKIPFAWMIDRDDRALRERYYRAMDSLLRFLDNSDITSWKESAANGLVKTSVIKTIRQFEMVYPLEQSSYMFHQLLPILVEIQSTRLKAIVGVDNLVKLIEDDPSVADLKEPSVRFLAIRAIIVAIERWSIDAFPLSVARRFSPTYQGEKQSSAAAKEEMDWYISKLNLQAQDAALDLQTVLSGNPYKDMSLIPENDPKNKYFTV